MTTDFTARDASLGRLPPGQVPTGMDPELFAAQPKGEWWCSLADLHGDYDLRLMSNAGVLNTTFARICVNFSERDDGPDGRLFMWSLAGKVTQNILRDPQASKYVKFEIEFFAKADPSLSYRRIKLGGSERVCGVPFDMRLPGQANIGKVPPVLSEVYSVATLHIEHMDHSHLCPP